MTTSRHSKSNQTWSPPSDAKIIDLTYAYNSNNNAESSIFIQSISDEIKLMLSLWIKMSFCGLLEITPQFVGKMFVGHIPDTNSSFLLSVVGLAQNYTNITAMSVGWGFTSGLLTLIPQCIGSNRMDLLPHYAQRAFFITLIILIFSTILQIYSGDILCAIFGYNDKNTDQKICQYVTSYCLHLIPFMYFTVWFTILQRIIQNLDYNSELVFILFISNILNPFWNYLFIYNFGFGYIGTALSMDITICCMFLLSVILLCYKGYGCIFKPIPIGITLDCNKIYEYLSLTIPGVIRTCSAWWIGELITILSGFVYNPYIAISSTVICYSIFEILLEFSVALGNVVNMRVGEYIGYGSIFYAKRVCKITALLDIIWAIILILILILFKDSLPKIYTNDKEIIAMSSKLMYFVMIICVLFSFFRVLSAIYQGLGKQNIVAIIMFISQDIIGFALTLVLLFGFNYKQYTDIGIYSIWSCASFGYLLVIILAFTILICKNKTIWREATNDFKLRVQSTQKILNQTKTNNYGAID